MNNFLLPLFKVDTLIDIGVAVVISVSLSLVAFHYIFHRTLHKKFDDLSQKTKKHKKEILSELRRIEKKAEIEQREQSNTQ